MKKLIVAVNEPTPENATVSPRFGRTPYFAIFEEGKEPKVVANPYANAPNAAGISAAQFVINEGAQAVASGNLGPNSAMVLQSAGIQTYIVPPGTPASKVWEDFLAGNLTSQEPVGGASAGTIPSVPPTGGVNPPTNLSAPYYGPVSWFGWGRGWGWRRGFGWGRGWGRGFGWGRGWGWGKGWGRGWW